MKVMVTGGTGMVGRNVVEALKQNSQYTVLAPPRSELDLLDKDKVSSYIAQHMPDAIVHAAAMVGGIQANINEPVKFLAHNSYINLNVIMGALAAGVKNLVYLGSSCMYPKDYDLLAESMLLDGKLEPTNEGYAIAKISGLLLCNYISQQYGFQYKSLIPCNLYGPYDNFDLISSHMLPAAIHKIHLAKVQNKQEVGIWGDGEARREFMYVGDLVRFIQLALERLPELPPVTNVGSGYDSSINEYYEATARVVGYTGSFQHELEKPVGMRRKLMDVTRAQALGWRAQTELSEGLQKTYEHFLSTEG